LWVILNVKYRASVSRSPTIVISYIMKKNEWSLTKAYDYVKMKRVFIQPNIGFISQLSLYEQKLFNGIVSEDYFSLRIQFIEHNYDRINYKTSVLNRANLESIDNEAKKNLSIIIDNYKTYIKATLSELNEVKLENEELILFKKEIYDKLVILLKVCALLNFN
jgi:hypothetical protein